MLLSLTPLGWYEAALETAAGATFSLFLTGSDGKDGIVGMYGRKGIVEEALGSGGGLSSRGAKCCSIGDGPRAVYFCTGDGSRCVYLGSGDGL